MKYLLEFADVLTALLPSPAIASHRYFMTNGSACFRKSLNGSITHGRMRVVAIQLGGHGVLGKGLIRECRPFSGDLDVVAVA